MPWVMKVAFCELGMATEVSFIADRAKPWGSGISHLEEGVASPVLSSLLDDKVLDEFTFHAISYLWSFLAVTE